ncbi:MAG: hypothetical protein J6R29_04370, partial [Clostridia bacterium]|nr:hypothetical protein [Clostridia bacterium]
AKISAENLSAISELAKKGGFFVPSSGRSFSEIPKELKDNPDINLNRDEKSIKELNVIQLKLLNNVCKYVKVGGTLYYSTCSILKSENVDIALKFLKENQNFESVEITSPLSSVKQEVGLQFLPHISNGAGFYVSAFKRIK